MKILFSQVNQVRVIIPISNKVKIKYIIKGNGGASNRCYDVNFYNALFLK